MPNSLTTFVHNHSGRVVGTLREGLTWLERFPELHRVYNAEPEVPGL